MKNEFPGSYRSVTASSPEEAHEIHSDNLEQLEKVLKGSTGFVLVGIARCEEKDVIINMAGGTVSTGAITIMLEKGIEFCKQLTRTPIVECDCPDCQARQQQQHTEH